MPNFRSFRFIISARILFCRGYKHLDQSTEPAALAMTALTSNSISASTFRLRDLPEELQRHCISFSLPSEWYIRASVPIRISSAAVVNPYIYGLRPDPPSPIHVHLVDKQTFLQARALSIQNFTGELYLANILDQRGFKTYSQYGLGQTRTPGRLDSFRDLITIVHIGSYSNVQDFRGLDPNLIGVLSKLDTVVAHSVKSLHEESLYGWGDANFMINMLSETTLIAFMQQKSEDLDVLKTTAAVEALWNAGIKTLLEMKVTMGSGEMMVSFYCIFQLHRNSEPTILGKHPVKEWELSSKFRKSIYEKAV